MTAEEQIRFVIHHKWQKLIIDFQIAMPRIPIENFGIFDSAIQFSFTNDQIAVLTAYWRNMAEEDAVASLLIFRHFDDFFEKFYLFSAVGIKVHQSAIFFVAIWFIFTAIQIYKENITILECVIELVRFCREIVMHFTGHSAAGFMVSSQHEEALFPGISIDGNIEELGEHIVVVHLVRFDISIVTNKCRSIGTGGFQQLFMFSIVIMEIIDHDKRECIRFFRPGGEGKSFAVFILHVFFRTKIKLIRFQLSDFFGIDLISVSGAWFQIFQCDLLDQAYIF